MFIEELEKGIQYATVHGSFNSMNVIEQAENVCVFGLGTYFQEAFVSQNTKEKFHVNLLSDNDPQKWGNIIEGIPVICPEELKKYPKLVVIIMLGNPTPVERQMRKMGISYLYHVNLCLDATMGLERESVWFKSQIGDIEKVYHFFEDDLSKKVYVGALCNRIAPMISQYSWEEIYSDEPQYFSQNEIVFHENESFVDCGAYIGDSVAEFVNAVGGKYNKIFTFEMDRDNFKKMEKNVAMLDNVVCFNYGVWSENKTVEYGTGSSENEPDEGKSIYKTEQSVNNVIQKAQVRKLDTVLGEEKVTFIKMDVEGAEIDALKGAQNIITSQKPKLAISVYHKTSDFWKIPLLIQTMVPGYKFMLRHHTKSNLLETVLYAFCE